ncbi:GNAT family protein [Terrabacter carboxydivorans]|uniref:GNAT family N-acetyltransferase n=1 Tax=Terrabacter carboxydivorans TaxID=619730 RepID=A0ABP5ZH10_9MICO
MTDTPLPYPDPALGDGQVGLRRWRESDVECIRLAGTDPRITAATTVPVEGTPEEAIAFIRRQWSRADEREGVSLAVVDVDDDRAVGLVWVALRPQQHVGGLGYWVVPPARGRGVATAAVRLVVPWALEALHLQRLEAWVEPDNLASQRTLLSAGFALEGRLRSILTLGGRPSDALVFSVVGPGA